MPGCAFAQARIFTPHSTARWGPGTGVPLILGHSLPVAEPPESLYQIFQCGAPSVRGESIEGHVRSATDCRCKRSERAKVMQEHPMLNVYRIAFVVIAIAAVDYGLIAIALGDALFPWK
jgi:hypothetical protein